MKRLDKNSALATQVYETLLKKRDWLETLIVADKKCNCGTVGRSTDSLVNFANEVRLIIQ